MDKDKLNDILDIASDNALTIDDSKKKQLAKMNGQAQLANEDFSAIRENMIDLIDNGKMALDDLISIAQSSQHPRAFEVVAMMMKTLMEANKDLLDTHRKRQDILKEVQDGSVGGDTINNNLIVTTAELQDLLKKNNGDTG